MDDTGELEDDFAFFNLSREQQKTLQVQETEDEFEVLPENWEAWTAFLSIQSQWMLAPSGIPYALDYSRVKAGWALAGITSTAEIFEKLRVIESTVVKLLREHYV